MTQLRSFIWKYPRPISRAIQELHISAAVISTLYWSSNKRARPYLVFMYYINPIFMGIGTTGYLVKIIQDGQEFTEYVDEVTKFLLLLTGFWIIVNVYMKRNEGKDCFNFISNCPYPMTDSRFVNDHLMIHNRIVFVACIALIIFCTVSFIITPILQQFYKDFPPILPYYYQIDLPHISFRIIIELLQLVQILFILVVLINLNILFVTFIRYIEYQCDEIIIKLLALKTELNIDKRHKDFVEIVEHHIFVLKLFDMFGALFRNSILVLAIVGTVILGLLGIALIVKFNWFLFMFIMIAVMIMLTGGYLTCALERKSEILHNSTFYAIPWDGDIAIVKELKFMNMYTKKTLAIQIGNGGRLTNQTLLMIARMAYSVVSFYMGTQKI